MKFKMEDTLFGVILCCIIGFIFMLIFSGISNTNRGRSNYKPTCDCDWEYEGENGSKAGAFYRCKKCGKCKYIPYKELMAMSEKDYKFWTTRPLSQEEKYRQEHKT